MEWLEHYRDAEMVRRLTERLRQQEVPPVRLMEVCGTHTMAIARYALRKLMPEHITLTSGPGCPVCVTAAGEIDAFIAAARLPRVTITTFGDLLRVPGSRSSLQEEQAQGADIRLVYSPLDALEIARKQPDREVIFLGVGFETTAPTVAAALLSAIQAGIGNFSVLSAHKVMPPALEALVAAPEVKVDGLLCPGHVSIIIGAEAYRPLVERYGTPCVVTGFEPVDILEGILLLTRQLVEQQPNIKIAYQRAVGESGNSRALEILHQVFEPADAAWRGLGTIPASGLAIRAEYQDFDAYRRFGLQVPAARERPGCQCGQVLKGLLSPPECKLFGKACHPGHPIGPCMVSSEGACAASFKYGS